MKVVICTENKAKNQAVSEVFKKIWPDFEIKSIKTESNVSEQPLTEEEGIKGAINRIMDAKNKMPNADFYVGLEGYVDTNQYGMFLAGAVVIEDKNQKQGIGISGKLVLPDAIRKEIEAGQELGPLIKKIMNDQEGKIRHFDGTNGILTKGLYNRVDEFKDACACALAPFISKEFY